VATVGLARVLAGARSFKDQGIANLSDTYRGQILIGQSEVRQAIIKDIPVREIANEVLTAALALAISLPVPLPFSLLPLRPTSQQSMLQCWAVHPSCLRART
jgi:hypothetical protein